MEGCREELQGQGSNYEGGVEAETSIALGKFHGISIIGDISPNWEKTVSCNAG